MNEFVIISKDVFEEMVGKFNRFSDRVNEILSKREEGRLSRWMDNQDAANSCASVREPCRRFATTARWLTSKLDIRFSTSRRTCCVSYGLWRTDERMPPVGERPSECN